MNQHDDARHEAAHPPLDVQGEGQSIGVPAAGEHEHVSYNPTGGPGIHHWQEATITKPGLGERGSVFFAAIEMTRMPMILTDPNLPDNPIVFANRAFQDLSGYTEEEVLGRNCRFLQGAHTDRETVAELRDAVNGHRAVSVELLNYKRDGTPFWNACFVAPVFDKHDKLLYFFASQLDVTRRRTSEQAFRQAQKMESIGQLTAGLAHDFNNLLQVVSGNLELALSRTDDESLRRPLENASRAAERGSRLTKQLLAFARKTRLEAKPTNLNNLITDFGDMLENSVGPQIEIELNLRSRVPPALVDPVHLEMAVLNVLINARDAMPKGGTVTISTSKVHLNGNAAAHHICRRATTWPCPSATGERACRRTCWNARRSHSSPPRARAKGPGSGSPWCMASCSSLSDVWRSTASEARARPSACSSQPRRHRGRPPVSQAGIPCKRSQEGRLRRSLWSRTATTSWNLRAST
jgi:PAS domain S-box-containing protein